MSDQTDIKLIVIDLDGTLLNSKSELSERNEKAIKAAIEAGIQVVLATGKTRHSALNIIERLELNTPGIYVQGLTIYDGDGQITYEQSLDPVVARQVITFAEDRGFDIVAYSGSKILVRVEHAKAGELHTRYHEPAPEAIGPLQNILQDMTVHKLIVVKANEPRRITALRWQLSKQLDGKGRLVQAAIPDMLEILPPNGSKGRALQALLKQMGIAADETMVIGDGENDLEMVKMAGLSVAMGNAYEPLKEAADHVTGTNDEDGVAQAIEEYVLKSSLDATAAKENETASQVDSDSTTEETTTEAQEDEA